MTKEVLPKDIAGIKRPGSGSLLVYAIDRERRDIMLWLLDEIGVDANSEPCLERAIYRRNEQILKDLL